MAASEKECFQTYLLFQMENGVRLEWKPADRRMKMGEKSYFPFLKKNGFNILWSHVHYKGN
jgi:hypothetical protein